MARTGLWSNDPEIAHAFCDIPVFPWHALSNFFEWNSQYLPAHCILQAGTSTYLRPQIDTGVGTTRVVLHPPLIPYLEETATGPHWTGNLQCLTWNHPGVLSLIAEPRRPYMVDTANRLRVNGTHYHEQLSFSGKLKIPSAFTASNTMDLAQPWVRFIAIQLTGPDMTELLPNQIPLGQFFTNIADDTGPGLQDPDYARRRDIYEKGEVVALNQPYKILHDQTWQIVKPDGTRLRQIPLKLKLTPRIPKRYATTDAAMEEDDAGAKMPQSYGPDYDGRIIYQFFSNVLQVPQANPELANVNPVSNPSWCGTWTVKIEDGNF